MKEVFACAVAAAMLVAPAGGQSTPAGKMRPRQVFVTVTDRAGAPILDLGQDDFEITEDGVTRRIARAGLANDPLRIALLVDTSDTTAQALNQIRAGLQEFFTALPAEHEVLFVSTGQQIRVRVQPTADRKKLNDAARALFSDGGTTRLMDAILEMDDRFLRKTADRWPAFVIITGDGAESSAPANEKKFNDWVRALPGRGIAAHGIVLKSKSGGLPEYVTNHVVVTAGGHYEVMNTSNGCPRK